MTYNLSFMNNATGVATIAQGVNTNSDGLFSIMLLISLYVLFFMVFNQYDIKKVAAGSSFLVALIAGGLYALEMINGYVLSVPVAILVVSMFILIWD